MIALNKSTLVVKQVLAISLLTFGCHLISIMVMNSLSILLQIFCILVKAQDPLGNDISGDNQTGISGHYLDRPVVVRVVDDSGRGMAGVLINFSVLQKPDALIVPDSVFTDPDGYARVKVKLGSASGDYYIMARLNSECLTFRFVALEQDWIVVFLLSIIGGLALFIFGLNYGSKGLIRATGSKTRDLLFSFTTNRLLVLISGFVTTVIFGSCTATASLLVKFVSAGIIDSFSAMAVMLGANIGATVSVQLLAFNIMNYALLIIAAGVFLRIFFPTLRNFAQFIFGFGLLFFALKIMSTGVSNVRYLSGFHTTICFLDKAQLWAIVVGALFAFIFRSGTAFIGFVLVLSMQSAISLQTALFLIMGANIGAVFFPILMADAVPSKRVVFANLFFKSITMAICIIFVSYIEQFLLFLSGSTVRQIANFHTFFNIATALIFLPILPAANKTLELLIGDTKKEILEKKRLDTSFLDAPAVGLGQAMKEILYMADKSCSMLEDAIKVYERKDMALRKAIIEADDEIDKMEEQITTYLSKLDPAEMDEDLRTMQVGLLTTTTEIEHIGDIISKNLMIYAKKQMDVGMGFSEEGFAEIKEYHNFVLRNLKMATTSLMTKDKKLALDVVEQGNVGYNMAKELAAKHLQRLHRGLKESLETSAIHLDIISDLERISFHTTEIGRVILSLK